MDEYNLSGCTEEKTLLGNTADLGTEDQGGPENGGKNNLTSKKDEEGWQAVGLK